MDRIELRKQIHQMNDKFAALINEKVNQYEDYELFHGINNEIVNLYKECISLQGEKIFDATRKLAEHLKSDKIDYVKLKGNTIIFNIQICLPSNRKRIYLDYLSDERGDYIVLYDSKDNLIELSNSNHLYEVNLWQYTRIADINYILGHLLHLTKNL